MSVNTRVTVPDGCTCIGQSSRRPSALSAARHKARRRADRGGRRPWTLRVERATSQLTIDKEVDMRHFSRWELLAGLVAVAAVSVATAQAASPPYYSVSPSNR